MQILDMSCKNMQEKKRRKQSYYFLFYFFKSVNCTSYYTVAKAIRNISKYISEQNQELS